MYADSFGTIPDQGVVGRCSAADTILIFIDPKHTQGMRDKVKSICLRQSPHELYHARRYAAQPVAENLGEALVEEGLASVFEEFMDPQLQVPYAHYLDGNELDAAWKQAQPEENRRAADAPDR